MHVIRARNVNQAWPAAVELILSRGTWRQSRNGDVKSLDEPVATVYERPRERVLFDPVRDANPIFHLHEALWMLAGRDDATWLDQFVRDFSARFSEVGGRMHGAYGKRWRGWFAHPAHTGAEDSSAPAMFDQLEQAVRLLMRDPYDRQVVVGMWDPSSDFGVPGLKDRPCNTHIYFRADRVLMEPIQSGESVMGSEVEGFGPPRRQLDMTVLCRSNDAVFGAYGANVVHMSILQEYIANMCGFEVGTYTQVSNNLHIYESAMDKVNLAVAQECAERTYPMNDYLPIMFPGGDQKAVDAEIREYVDKPLGPHPEKTSFRTSTAAPMFRASQLVRAGDFDAAKKEAGRVQQNDWRVATLQWVGRRERAKKESGK